MSENINLKFEGNWDNRHYFLLSNNTIAEIGFDDDGEVESPREYDNDSKFITFSSNGYSPDENPFNTWDDMLKHFGVKWNEHEQRDMYSELAQLEEKALAKGIVLLPVWKYDHGTVVYGASERCPFPDFGYDSGLSGVIYEKRDRRNVEQVKNSLKEEVELYNKWNNGEIYRFTTYDREGSECDSYGGYYDVEDMRSDMWGKPIEDLGVHSNIDDCLSDDFTKNALEKFDQQLKQNDKER